MGAVKIKMYAEILSPLPMTSREDGERVLSLWESCLPNCLPDKVGNWEPIDQVFALDRKDDMLNLWRWPFFAVKKKPKMHAGFFMRKGKMLQHASWILDFAYGDVNSNEIAQFLRQAATLFEADLGCLTLLTNTEIEVGRANGTVRPLNKKGTRFSFSISSQMIQKCIPDVHWITIFGTPYLKMFGKEKLLSAPAHKAEALNDDTIIVQLTPSLEDMRGDPSGFAEARARLKAFLGETAFFDAERAGECKRPEFIWK
ncbi:hypothetical protein SBDP1_520002 [Syntrophobacter sp. SbD1]|nr:hypothetical protein SBDP1_520002 [Syntrophobacter sp. SbD1]